MNQIVWLSLGKELIFKMESKVYYGEYTLEHWIDLILKGNIILPDYQRLFVWDKDKAEKLIESINNNEFVPPVTIGSYDNGSKRENLILDGQQRLTSIFLSFLGVFPNKEKYKKKISILIDDNDSEIDIDEFDNILEWSLKKLTEKGNSKNKILSKIKEGNYDTISEIDSEFLRSHYLGFSYLVPQVASGENVDEFYSEQQKYYSSVFRNINIQGETLLPQESRKSLYFLKDTLVDFFEPEFSKSIRVNDSQMDFVRYIALISHYEKQVNINKVGYRYARKMEKLYEEFIYFVAYDQDSELFALLPSYVTEGNYADKLKEISELFRLITVQMELNSIIDIDLVAFGLLKYIIFETRTLDIEKLNNLVEELKLNIQGFKNDVNHTKNPSALKHLRGRIQTSYDIYGKYIK